MKNKINIALADDEILIREGIKTLLKQENNFNILFDVANGAELITHLEYINNIPDIILMDINMPEVNGIDATKFVLEHYPEIKIIALSSYNSESFISKMLNVGAVCYIPKGQATKDMIYKINKVYENGFFYEDTILQYLKTNHNTQSNQNNELSSRELDVLKLICDQKTATEIAEQLSISPRTVDGHRNKLLEKTKSKNVVGLVVYAIQNKLFMV